MYKITYFAGGCFWGMEKYFSCLNGVKDVISGYANGISESTSYTKLKETDHVECIKIIYNDYEISLEELLIRYFHIVNPYTLNKQGNDVGRQYRSGLYYENDEDHKIIQKVYNYFESKSEEKYVVEVKKLQHFIKAEEYHQDYLDKNPLGYCHINWQSAYDELDYPKRKYPMNELCRTILEENNTERPFSSKYEKFDDKGIYVLRTNGMPLFSSEHKFDSGCGWPSFYKTITANCLNYLNDYSHNMIRTEIRSLDDHHLGHVFNDNPNDSGLRFCLNGAVLKFIPYDEMVKEGYELYQLFFRNEYK